MNNEPLVLFTDREGKVMPGDVMYDSDQNRVGYLRKLDMEQSINGFLKIEIREKQNHKNSKGLLKNRVESVDVYFRI